jgi:hypothetical protein
LTSIPTTQLLLCLHCAVTAAALLQVTLVITDVEGSTELWEWDYGVMTLAQEVHDSVMRSLIGRCVWALLFIRSVWWVEGVGSRVQGTWAAGYLPHSGSVANQPSQSMNSKSGK